MCEKSGLVDISVSKRGSVRHLKFQVFHIQALVFLESGEIVLGTGYSFWHMIEESDVETLILFEPKAVTPLFKARKKHVSIARFK